MEHPLFAVLLQPGGSRSTLGRLDGLVLIEETAAGTLLHFDRPDGRTRSRRRRLLAAPAPARSDCPLCRLPETAR